MRHLRARELSIRQALHGPLDSNEQQTLDAHLATCQACQDFNHELQAKGRTILPAPTPRASFEHDLFTAIMQSSRPAPIPPRRHSRLRPVLAVAASIPAILVSLLLARGTLLLESKSLLRPADTHAVRATEDPTKLAIARASGIPAADIKIEITRGGRAIQLATRATNKKAAGTELADRPLTIPDAEETKTKKSAQPTTVPKTEDPKTEKADRVRDTISTTRTMEETPDLAKPSSLMSLRPSASNQRQTNIMAGQDKARLVEPKALAAMDLAKKEAEGTKDGLEGDFESSLAAKKTASDRDQEDIIPPTRAEQAPTSRAKPVILIQPTASVQILVPDSESADRIHEVQAEIQTVIARLLPQGTAISLVPTVSTSQHVSPRVIDPTPTSLWGGLVFVLWLVFEAGVRILNVIAGAAHRSRRLGRLDTALGAILGTLWLPVVLVRILNQQLDEATQADKGK